MKHLKVVLSVFLILACSVSKAEEFAGELTVIQTPPGTKKNLSSRLKVEDAKDRCKVSILSQGKTVPMAFEIVRKSPKEWALNLGGWKGPQNIKLVVQEGKPGLKAFQLSYDILHVQVKVSYASKDRLRVLSMTSFDTKSAVTVDQIFKSKVQ
jgi:hypothetical protein